MSTQQALQAIYDERGELSPEVVLDVASDPGHELHSRFEWDESEAARRYRLVQAQYLIRSVKVTVQRTPESQPVRVRAFIADRELGPVALPGADPDGPDPVGNYRPVEEVVESDILRTAWFRSLERDWKRLKARAGASQEFAAMVLADVTGETA